MLGDQPLNWCQGRSPPRSRQDGASVPPRSVRSQTVCCPCGSGPEGWGRLPCVGPGAGFLQSLGLPFMREQEGSEDKGGPWWPLPLAGLVPPHPSPPSLEPWQPRQVCGSLSMVLSQGSWVSSVLSSLSRQWLWSGLSETPNQRGARGHGQSRAWPEEAEREAQRSALRGHQELQVILKNLQLLPRKCPLWEAGEAHTQGSFPDEGGPHSCLAAPLLHALLLHAEPRPS